jgi:hypothetical protein
LFARECVAAAGGPVEDHDPPATTPGDPGYAEELVARAHTLHLADDVEWKRLGHWHRAPDGDFRGEPVGRLFWLASDGRTNPSAELDATIRGIWSAEPTDPDVQHPFCRFPARLMWLDEKLHLEASRLPARQCRRYSQFVGKLRATSVALVFSAYYLNSPASAFGHTFLRIHREWGQPSNELLDTGVDFSADVDTNNAFLYAFKGLTGLFPGRFHSLPFYYKVREYNDYESRDLWEYELDLSPRALAMLVAHLWEEGSTYFAYFYLSENCSYHVLAALEVSDPKLHLLDRLRNPVVPVDTVRALVRSPGLVRAIHYRPALRTTLRAEIARLDASQVRALAALTDDADAPLPDSMPARLRAEVLDAASDLLDVLEPHAMVKDDDPRVARSKQRLLERRAAIAIPSEPVQVPVPLDKMPHAGHGTSRIAFGTGYSPDLGGDFYELRQRLALHDLADPPDGFPDGSQIEFLPLRLRYYPKQRSLELEDFSILRLASLSPWDRFRHPMSLMLNAGATRLRDDGCPGCLASVADAAVGLSLGSERALTVFALADVGIQFDSRMNGLKGSDWRPGVGPIAGARWRLSHTLVWTADGRWSWYPLANPFQAWLVETSARWALATDAALGVDFRAQPLATEGELSAFLYY